MRRWARRWGKCEGIGKEWGKGRGYGKKQDVTARKMLTIKLQQKRKIPEISTKWKT